MHGLSFRSGKGRVGGVTKRALELHERRRATRERHLQEHRDKDALQIARLAAATAPREALSISAQRLYLTVAACGLLVYLGALWNRWAWDDVPIIYYNPLLHTPGALWRALISPYWPADLAGGLYR